MGSQGARYDIWWCYPRGTAHWVGQRVNRAAAERIVRELNATHPERLYWCERSTNKGRARATTVEDR
jgi:hypothetical protein